MSDDESKKCQKEYGEGFKKGLRGEGRIEKELSDLFSIVIPDPLVTEESKSHTEGIRAGLQERDLHGRKEESAESSGGRSSSHSSNSSSSSSTPASYETISATGRSSWGWLVVIVLAAVGILAYVARLQQGTTNIGSTQPAASAGAPVYNLQCGQTFDIQLPPAVRRTMLVVPPCKCSDLSELNYDCTGWVRIMQPDSHWQMSIRNVDGSEANECVVLMEYKKGRGPQGVSQNTPIKIAGCGASDRETSTVRTKGNPNGEPLKIPDRFTMQNIQDVPIRVSIEFH